MFLLVSNQKGMTMSKETEQSIWQCGRFQIKLNQTKIMGIVNITPDSFSDGGTYGRSIYSALHHAEQLVKDGADILDIGGESSRPGADVVSIDEEWQRIYPILQEIVHWGVPISIDTRHTRVMQQAIDNQWVDIVNDIQALTDDGALSLLAHTKDIGICLMHMQGLPEDMQQHPSYNDVVLEVGQYLKQRVEACIQAGIGRQRLVVDPGFGFGKTCQHNIELMQHFHQWQVMCDVPVLIGVSRKRMIAEITQENNMNERVCGSVVAAIVAVARGASIVRVHDVRQTKQGLQIWQALGGVLA